MCVGARVCEWEKETTSRKSKDTNVYASVCVVRVTVCVSALFRLFHTQHVVWFSVTTEIKAAGPTGGGRV